ncbi:MAG: alpha/beta hydrolase [bacterium]
MKGIDVTLMFVTCMAILSCSSMDNGHRLDLPLGSDGQFYTVSDGTKIFTYTFLPNNEYSKTVYILSGITGINHNREMDIINTLSGGTNRIVVIHPRGTGYSDGKRGDTNDFKAILDDYIEIINSDKKSGSRILFGHSMSTAMAIGISSRVENLSGIILVNPPVKLKSSEGMTPGVGEYIKYAFYYIFALHTPIVNMAGNPELIKNPDERKESEERNNDPLLVKYFSMYCMFESKKLMDSMPEMAKACKQPLLLVYGKEDSIIEKEGCDLLYNNWVSSKKTFVCIEDGPHGKLTVIKAQEQIRDWIAGL